MSDVTQLLDAIEQGDSHAAEKLLPLLYHQLRQLAVRKMAQETPGQTLQATALVHEAYLRLVDTSKVQNWNSRGHFFAAAAEAMRRILVEQARRKSRQRHGGDRKRVDLDGVAAGESGPADDLLALDEALDRLADEDQAAARVVQLRYFAGLTIDETASALGCSVRTANRHWAFAKARLFQQLGEPSSPAD